MNRIVFLGLLVAMLTSCNKGSQPISVNSKKLLVSTVINIDLSKNDTLTAYYTYNSNSQIKTITNKRHNLVYGTTDYLYDINNNVIKITYSFSGTTEVFDIVYSNGQPVSANYTSTSQYGTTSEEYCKYTVANDKIVKVSFDANVDGGTTDEFSYLNNNISQLSETFSLPAAPASIISYVYGTKNSPFKNSRFKWVLDFEEGNEYIEYDNNDLSGTNGGLPYQNIYNSSGYPTQIKIGNSFMTFTYLSASNN